VATAKRQAATAQQINQSRVAVVGGKDAQLGQLSRIESIRVPAGFCATTGTFRRIMAGVVDRRTAGSAVETEPQ
jgi:rifampicin phosphotransferase